MLVQLVWCLSIAFTISIFATVIGVIRHVIWRQRNSIKYQRVWYALASQVGLTFEPGLYYASPRITGLYRGRPLTLDLWVDPADTLSTDTRVSLALKHAVGGYLDIAENDLLTGVKIAIQSIFNSRKRNRFVWRFSVRGDPRNLATRIVSSPNLCRKLLSTHSARIELGDQQLRFIHKGIVSDGEYLVFLFDLLSDVARLLEAD
jgi:hypothetical protein